MFAGTFKNPEQMDKLTGFGRKETKRMDMIFFRDVIKKYISK